MAGRVRSITFEGGELQDRLGKAPPRMRRYLTINTQYYAQVAEREARLNAPWTDRTGNARNGLVGIPITEDDMYAIVLAHSVDYGIWLEVRWGGRYATILPTLRKVGPQYIESSQGLLGSI